MQNATTALRWCDALFPQSQRPFLNPFNLTQACDISGSSNLSSNSNTVTPVPFSRNKGHLWESLEQCVGEWQAHCHMELRASQRWEAKPPSCSSAAGWSRETKPSRNWNHLAELWKKRSQWQKFITVLSHHGFLPVPKTGLLTLEPPLQTLQREHLNACPMYRLLLTNSLLVLPLEIFHLFSMALSTKTRSCLSCSLLPGRRGAKDSKNSVCWANTCVLVNAVTLHVCMNF